MAGITMTNDQFDRSFLDASIPKLVKELSIDEKVSLLAGRDWWNTVPIPRLNIPSVKVTDGPNGARGDSFFNMTPASALPNATAIGATFSRPLVHSAGKLLAKETKARNAVCLLAPTINIQRSPLGGRAFESFSEDPTLSGEIAGAYVNGLQSDGVSATIKHFVANDQEHERMGEDSIVEERALREVYLRAFQIAQKRSTPWAYMTSYNKLNGTHCSENKWLLQDVLRKEWKHDGLIMSDWYGTYSVSESINAGLNLEMPGETIWRTSKQVLHLIRAYKIDLRTIDKVAGEMLAWVQKLARLNPELVYAKPSPERTRTEDKEEDAKLLRQLGGESLVVLKNENGVLPVTGQSKKVAVIGPNVKARVLTGGGSAMLKSSWSVSPWEGLVDNAPDGVELSYATGAVTSKFLPALDENFTCLDGSSGFDVAHYAIVDGKQGDKPVVTDKRTDSSLFMADFLVPELRPYWITEVQALFTSPISGEYEFSMCVTGMGRLWVNDQLVVDASNEIEKGDAFFGCGSLEIKGRVKVEKGKQYRVRALHDGRQPPRDIPVNTPLIVNAVRVGAAQVIDDDEAIAEAVELAKKSDTAVIVAGLNADWESEGYDRPDLSLPLRTNDLIAAVAAANPKTVVVLQAGSAVSMPWINEVAGVVYAWYGGNECGNSIADVVYGKINPSGRLPISLPVREEDIAAALNYKSARTKIHYEEGIWVGYKHHNERKIAPLFPFGHGLSYTTFAYSDLEVSAPKAGASADEWSIEVSVTVKNTGKIAGSHSVHFYLSPPDETATSLRHPQWTLQGFEKVYDLAPGAEETVKVTLDKYAVSHWDEPWKTWRAELGEWTVRIGRDASTMEGEAKFTIDEDLEWTGI